MHRSLIVILFSAFEPIEEADAKVLANTSRLHFGQDFVAMLIEEVSRSVLSFLFNRAFQAPICLHRLMAFFDWTYFFVVLYDHR